MFFKTKDSIPNGYGFEIFDLTHLLWLILGLCIWISACILYKRLTPNRQKKVLTVVGITIFMLEVIKDLLLLATGEFTWENLPFHLCGINILLIGFDIIKQNKVVRSFLYYIAIPGAALALIFPNWTTLPLWNFYCLHSFIMHILLVLYPLLLVSSNQADTDIKSALKAVVLLLVMAVPVYFLNLLLDTNFMFLMNPDKGNPLELFEKILGSHLWGFPILLPIVILIMRLPILILQKIRKSSKEI